MDVRHPVDSLIDALRQGEATIIELADRTGFYAAGVISLIVRARASGYSIDARHEEGVTYYSLKEKS